MNLGPHNLDKVISHSSEYDGDNLVGPGSLDHVVFEKTLLDLHRELIEPALFQSFTSTGDCTHILICLFTCIYLASTLYIQAESNSNIE